MDDSDQSKPSSPAACIRSALQASPAPSLRLLNSRVLTTSIRRHLSPPPAARRSVHALLRHCPTWTRDAMVGEFHMGYWHVQQSALQPSLAGRQAPTSASNHLSARTTTIHSDLGLDQSPSITCSATALLSAASVFCASADIRGPCTILVRVECCDKPGRTVQMSVSRSGHTATNVQLWGAILLPSRNRTCFSMNGLRMAVANWILCRTIGGP
ncbi:hypothetical protein BKA80DRAFT_268732 [Phyllosticta citrichinensis]